MNLEEGVMIWEMGLRIRLKGGDPKAGEGAGGVKMQQRTCLSRPYAIWVIFF